MVKGSVCSAEGTGSILGLGRSPGEGNGYPLQYSCLENPIDRGAWWATVHGVTKSWAFLLNYHLLSNTSLNILLKISTSLTTLPVCLTLLDSLEHPMSPSDTSCSLLIIGC